MVIVFFFFDAGNYTLADVLQITGHASNGGLKSAVALGKRAHVGVGGSLAHFVNSDSACNKGSIRKVRNVPN